MKNRIKAIRVVIKSIRSTSKTKAERVLRLRMLMEQCRIDLYGDIYDFEFSEIKFIDFLTIFSIVYFCIQFLRSALNLQHVLIGLIMFTLISMRRLSIYRHQSIRSRREFLKTKRVLGAVKKNELRKLDADIQDWYMLRSEFSDVS